MTDYTARIRAKGLDSTGVTEALAKQFYSSLGAHGLAIVEYRVEARRENADAGHSVDLILTQVEPSTVAFLDDHLRELMRALYRNRALAEGQGILPGSDDGPALQDVVRAGEATLVRDDAGNADRVWDGDPESAVLSCAFPGCYLDAGHEGDHDVFAPAPEGDASPDLGDDPDGDLDEQAGIVEAQAAKRLAAVPDPFAAGK